MEHVRTSTRFLLSSFYTSAFVGNVVAIGSCTFCHAHCFKSPVVGSDSLKSSPVSRLGWPVLPQKDTVPSHSFVCATPCAKGSFTLTTTHGADEDTEVWRSTALSMLTEV